MTRPPSKEARTAQASQLFLAASPLDQLLPVIIAPARREDDSQPRRSHRLTSDLPAAQKDRAVAATAARAPARAATPSCASLQRPPPRRCRWPRSSAAPPTRSACKSPASRTQRAPTRCP
eukprot:6034699-Pleurochrysis_carterae.AAC.1